LPFLKNLARMLGSSKPDPAVYLAAFGKHPGWNDHIDDIGLDTDDLINIKRLLYLQGINQNIDGGAWDKLDPPQRLNAFRHDFLWQMTAGGGGGQPSSPVAGRLWSSVDGKGRDKYPMVLCADTVELPDNFAAITALPFLAKTHERCAAATDAQTVRKVIDTDREALRAMIQPVPTQTSLHPSDIAKVAGSPDLAPSREGFHRIIYQIARGMSAYRPGAANPAARAEKIRVPLCGLRPHEAILFWLRFCRTLLSPNAPILLIAPEPQITRTEFNPDSTGWIDIIVGEPTAADLFCIKAATHALPLTSDIPYTLDPSFRAAINHFVDACAATPPGSPLPAWPAL
jgi:hypothetical protein